ncbi:MAG: LexA family protein [Planctomycetota bacterium]
MRVTRKQSRLLAWLAEQAEAGAAPGFQDAAAALGYATPSAVHRLVAALAEQGLLERDKHLHRCRITDVGWRALGRCSPDKGIPILGAIAAGSPILAEEQVVGHLPDLQARAGRFALRINGESMVDAGIDDGDHAIIDAGREVRDGDIAAVLVEDEATLKRVRFSSTGIRLQAANPAHPERELHHERDRWLILGGLHAVVRTIA